MRTFGTYVLFRDACKIRDYLTANKIPFDEWHDIDGGYEFEAYVTVEQYDELMNI